VTMIANISSSPVHYQQAYQIQRCHISTTKTTG